MIKNKRGHFLLAVFLAVLIILPSVSALSYSGGNLYFLEQGANRLVNIVSSSIGPIFDALLGEYTGNHTDLSDGEFLFMRILLLIIVFIVIQSVVKTLPTFKDNQKIVFIISAAVSIMAVRYMSKSDFIIGILLPYGALGVAITTILPFIIFFWFLHSANVHGFGRKIGWLLFAIVLLALWIPKYSQLSEITNYVYIGCFAAVALAFFFDRSIHRYFSLHEMGHFFAKANQRAISMLQGEYLNIINVDTPEAKSRRSEIESKLKELGANVP
jgi:hypothetical protein